MDRRTFIEKSARGGLLAAIAVTAGVLAGRGQLKSGEECPLDFACRDCRILDVCGLSQAEKERKGKQ